MSKSMRRGGVVATVLISVLVVAVLAVTALVFTGLYVARNVRVEKTEGKGGELVKIETPVGAIRVQTGKDSKRLNIPIYPGAVESSETGNAANVEVDFGQEHKELSIVAAKYTTADSVEKVLEYYRKELPHWMFSHMRHGAFHMEYTEGGHKRVIGIREHHGKTEIGLASVGEPPAN
jgi:hypothetical protein